MPFANYSDFDACTSAHSDKRDPGAYCAAIKRQAEKLRTDSDDGDVDQKALPDPVSLHETAFEAHELDAIALEFAEWDHYRAEASDSEGWLNGETGAVIYAADTPEGVPDDAYSISDRSECDGTVHEGQRGGLYCVPNGGDGEGDGSVSDDDGVSTDPNPDEDIPNFRESESATEAIESTNAEPTMGFTFHRNLDQQELGERDEWAIGLGGIQLDREISKDDIVDLYEEHLDLLEDYTGLRIGGYHFEEGGRYEVELSMTVTNEDEARELGEELNQESVFNLDTEELIFTDGDGDPPLDSEDEIRDVLDRVESLSEKANTVAVEQKGTMADAAHDKTAKFEGPDGRRLSFAQIAMASAKDPDVAVEHAENGFRVNGDLFTPVEDD